MRDVDVFPAPAPVLFSPPQSSPTRNRRFATALAAAFDDGRGAPSASSSKTRPSWLLRPRDAAGNPRPATPTSPELRDALRLARAHDPATLTVSDRELSALPNFTRQFWETKRALMDVVVMCRHGTFYNMFDVDSDVGIDVGLNISGKACAFMQKVGCHHEVFDAWARKVLARGWAVARVEETDEKDADRGGIIRREVTEILTPALDRGLLRDDAASYLLALAEAPWPPEDDEDGDGDVQIGVTMIDAAVGEIILGSFVDGPSRDVLAALLARVEPREVIVSVTRRRGKASDATLAALTKHGRERRDACAFRRVERGDGAPPEFTREDTLAAVAHFGGIERGDGGEGDGGELRLPRALRDASPVAMESLAYAVRHCAWAGCAPAVLCQGTFRRLVIGDGEAPPPPSETTGTGDDAYDDYASDPPSAAAALAAMGMRATYDPDDAANVRVDAATAASLHLVRGDGGGGGGGGGDDASVGSLLAFLDDTVTRPGRRRLREWILAPLSDAQEIARRLDALDALCCHHHRGGGAGGSATILEGVRRALRAIPCDAQRGTARAVALDDACARASEAALAHGAAPPSDVAAVVAGAGAAAAAAAAAGRRGGRARLFEETQDSEEDGDRVGEAAVAFWSPRGRDLRAFVGTVDAIVATAEALAELPAPGGGGGGGGGGGILGSFRELGRAVLRPAKDLRARVELASELVARVCGRNGGGGGDDDDDDDARAAAKPTPSKRTKKSKKTAALRDAPCSWLFEEGGPLATFEVLPSPGTCETFDDAMAYLVDASARGNFDDDDDDVVEDAAAAAAAAATREISSVVHEFATGRHLWRAVVSAGADFDALQSFASRTGPGAVTGPFCRPTFLEDDDDGGGGGGGGNRLELRDSWHPLVPVGDSRATIAADDADDATAPFVRNDVVLGGGDAPACMLLTGPNMGGKSTLLRQVAVAVIMAQCGCYVPAASASLHVVDAVACRIGAGDGIASGVSTFLAEMSETSAALRRATKRSLLIVDELGRGTSTTDGYAIAFAVLTSIARQTRCRCLFATHFHQLAEDVGDDRGVVAAHMAAATTAREGNGNGNGGGGGGGGCFSDITFEYKLTPGPAPLGSCALNVARLAGFPEKVLKNAAEVASSSRTFIPRPKRPRPAAAAEAPGPLSPEAWQCFKEVVTDPAVRGVPGAVADDAWARKFYALWKRCRALKL